MMTQGHLPFQYQVEKNSTGLTGFSGLPLYVELAMKSGLVEALSKQLQTKRRGWSDTEVILSLLLLNLAGGDCISDIERLEQDSGLRSLLMHFSTYGMLRAARRSYAKRWRREKTRGLPSNAAIHRYLSPFHASQEEEKRCEGKAFIPAPNAHLKSLQSLNVPLLSYVQQQHPSTEATLDQDATLTATHKRNAYYCYKKYKAYQPLNTYWAEQGMLLHSEFRDGNVPAGYEQLRVLKEALSLLPAGIARVSLRSDSAGYQTELLAYCAEGKDERFGVIEFAIAAKVSSGFKQAVSDLNANDWQRLYREESDGTQIPTTQEWAEVCYVPDWAAKSKHQPNYRYLAIREKMEEVEPGSPPDELNLPFPVIQVEDSAYKLFALVTNRTLDGNALIQWHRARCGKSEQVHHSQKAQLAGGQLPSNLFGVNAAWWQLMVLAFNLNRLMQLLVLPLEHKEQRMKALRFHVIQLPGRLIFHARQYVLRVEQSAYELYAFIRKRISALPFAATAPPLGREP